MEYFVADSFKHYVYDITKAYKNSSGKMVVKAKNKCDRCNGTGIAISHIENGVPIPYINDNGICYACNGVGYITKEIRLYTEKEKAAADRAKQRQAERKVEEKLAAAERKKAEWLTKNGFTSEGFTAVYIGANSFDVKNELKEQGWKYSPVFGWRSADISAIETYGEDNVAIISADQVVSFNIYGEGCFLSTAANLIQQLRDAHKPQSKSEWIGEVKEKLVDLPVVIQRITGFGSAFGWTNVITFTHAENILIWMTSSDISHYTQGEEYLLSATVKEHTTYKNEKQTKILRVKLK